MLALPWFAALADLFAACIGPVKARFCFFLFVVGLADGTDIEGNVLVSLRLLVVLLKRAFVDVCSF